MTVPQPSPQPAPTFIERAGDFMKKYWRAYLVLFVFAGLIVALDQWTKVLVRTNMLLGSDWLPASLKWLEPYARIRYWYNSGAAFGIFQNGNLVFTILAIIVVCLILYYFPLTIREGWWFRLAMVLQLAGASGNLIDRLQFHHVTDFISVGNFAIFNVSDASISTGVVVLILGVWIKDQSDKRKAAAAAAAAAGQEEAPSDRSD